MGTAVYTTVEESKRHTHSCFLYLTDDQKWDTVAAFFAKAVARRDKCLFLYHQSSPHLIEKELTQRGIPVEVLKNKSQFEICSMQDFYYPEEVFDEENSARFFSRWFLEISQYGFNGITVAGEGDFVSEKIPGIERWTAFEKSANEMIKGKPITALCMYHKKRVSPIILEKMIREEVHPYQFKPSKKITSIRLDQ